MLTIIDIKLLSILNKKQCINNFNGIGRQEITEQIEKIHNRSMSSSGTYQSLKRLLNEKLISEGIKQGKANTYYITEQGINFLIRNTQK